jgi:hypothetical protein
VIKKKKMPKECGEDRESFGKNMWVFFSLKVSDGTELVNE